MTKAPASRRRAPDASLGGVWHSNVRRLFFFTYRFDFRWFHNRVLNPIRRQSLDHAEIDVFASRFANAPTATPVAVYGDLYALEEWAKWRGRLRIHFLPTRRHLFHNKFILVERADGGAIDLGLGSSNLTSSGWATNFEAWTVLRGPDVGAATAFLSYLRDLREVNGEVLSPWLRRMPAPSRAPRALDWLWGN